MLIIFKRTFGGKEEAYEILDVFQRSAALLKIGYE